MHFWTLAAVLSRIYLLTFGALLVPKDRVGPLALKHLPRAPENKRALEQRVNAKADIDARVEMITYSNYREPGTTQTYKQRGGPRRVQEHNHITNAERCKVGRSCRLYPNVFA